jgi:hypothetical protein
MNVINNIFSWFTSDEWVSSDGEVIKIKDMSDRRLENTLAFVYRYKKSFVGKNDRSLSMKALEKEAIERKMDLKPIKVLAKIREERRNKRIEEKYNVNDVDSDDLFFNEFLIGEF